MFWLVIGLQLLHAFTFGAIHSVSIEFIRRYSPENYLVGVWRFIADVFGVGGPWVQLCQGLPGNLWVAVTRFYVSD